MAECEKTRRLTSRCIAVLWVALWGATEHPPDQEAHLSQTEGVTMVWQTGRGCVYICDLCTKKISDFHLIASAKCVFNTAVKTHFHPPGYDRFSNVPRPRGCSSAPSAPVLCTPPGAQLLFAFKIIPLTEPYNLPLHSIPHPNCYHPTLILTLRTRPQMLTPSHPLKRTLAPARTPQDRNSN